MKNCIFRGILIGGSLGVLLFLAGVVGGGIGHAFFAGSLAGALAGATMGIRQKKAARKK